MMLTTSDLRAARRDGWAIGAFNTYGSDVTDAVIAAGERTSMPVILQTGAGPAGRELPRSRVAQMAAAARVAPGQVGAHLDHCRDLEQIRVALDLGCGSVMVDGSHLPFAQNVALTARAVALGRSYDVWVEGELGAVAGDEDCSSDARAAGVTDPDQARSFVDETGVDLLAVAVGNVHGLTTEPVRLDLGLLSRIGQVCPVPLVLHGASGVTDNELTAAVAAGVVKVNVNTELRRAFLTNLAVEEAQPTGWSMGAVIGPAARAAGLVAETKIRTLATSIS